MEEEIKLIKTGDELMAELISELIYRKIKFNYNDDILTCEALPEEVNGLSLLFSSVHVMYKNYRNNNSMDELESFEFDKKNKIILNISKE